MSQDRFLIAPLDKGIQQNVKPWLIMDDAFVTLENVYSWRGSIRKRVGARVLNGQVSNIQQQLLTRLRVNLGNTAGVTGNFGPVNVPGATFKIGQMFSIGDTIFTVHQNGAMYSTGTATGTYNTATGAVTIVGNNENPATAVYWYPSEPVMHLAKYNVAAVNDEVLIAFDTQFAYQFTYTTGWARLNAEAVLNDSLWTGNNSNFHWSTNFRGTGADNFILFVTNGVVADNIRYWDNTQWRTLQPLYAAGVTIDSCKVIIPFKGRLLLMNITESGGGGATYVNRVRWSQVGDPLAADAFREDITGKGSFEDFPVNEAIIGAQFLKDRLIVFLEASTWEIVYTGNPIDPFLFQQINSELGVESGNSIITFDNSLLGFGFTGIHSCNGQGIDRIDTNIPEEIFTVNNSNNGPSRVAGIRDYYTEMAYWSYNSIEQQTTYNTTFPNMFLTYNYKNGSWAINHDSITAFGNYQITQNLEWQAAELEWQENGDTWHDADNQDRFEYVIAGNQQGFTFLLDRKASRNCLSLQITDIAIANDLVTLTVIDHNLKNDDYIYISGVTGTTNLNNIIFRINTTSNDTITFGSSSAANAYTGGGTIERISILKLVTKDYNFYTNVGKKFKINKIDFFLDRTPNGGVTVFPIVNSNRTLIGESEPSITVSQGDYSLPTTQIGGIGSASNVSSRIWNSMYIWSEGETIALNISLTEAQSTLSPVVFSEFQLNAMIFYTSPTDDLAF